MGTLDRGGRLMDLVVSTREVDHRCIVEADGDLDMFDAPVLRGHLQQLLAAGQRDLVVDLRCVDFLGSSGLAVLVEALNAASAAGGSLVLVCTDPRFLLVLDLTGLRAHFRIHPSVEEALAAEGSPGDT
jgi:anti-sigma B factor antagonist